MADDGIARAVSPAHTPGDSDTLFVLGTARLAIDTLGDANAVVTQIGTAGANVVSRAIVHALLAAKSTRASRATATPSGPRAGAGNKRGDPTMRLHTALGALFIRLALAAPAFAQALPQTPGPKNAITDVPGIEVGHYTATNGTLGMTGTTAIIARGGATAGVTQRVPPGTRLTDLLSRRRRSARRTRSR